MNLPILGQPISPERQSEPSTCESCGEAFACGATLAGCWCAEIEVSEAVREKLRSRFRSCLCRACLERFAAGHEESVEETRTESAEAAT